MIMRTMRDNLHILKILFGILLVVLAVGLILPGTDLGQREAASAALMVEGVPVPSERYSQALNAVLEDERSSRGGELSDADARQARKTVAERLVEEQLAVNHAEDLGASVSLAEFQQAVLSDPSLRDEKGGFDRRRYEQLLIQQTQGSGMSVEQVEASFQRGMLLQKVRTFWSNQANLTPAELGKARAKLHRRVRAQALVWEAARLQASLQLSDEDLRDYYSRNRQRWVVPGEVKARQIVVRADFGAPTAQARAKAEAILAKLKGGADFKALAKAENPDKATQESAGDLGWLKREDFRSPSLAAAAFALKEGGVSDVVETSDGYTIVKAEGVKKGFEPTFENTKSKVRADLLKERALKQASQSARQALTRLKAGEKPEALAKALNAQLTMTDWFDRDAKRPLPALGDTPGLAKGLLYLDKDEVPPSPAGSDKGTAVCLIREERPGQPPKKPEDAQEREVSAAANARAAKADLLYKEWIAGLRAKAEVKDQVGALN